MVSLQELPRKFCGNLSRNLIFRASTVLTGVKTGSGDSPIFRVTVIMFRDIVDSVIVLKDEH